MPLTTYPLITNFKDANGNLIKMGDHVRREDGIEGVITKNKISKETVVLWYDGEKEKLNYINKFIII